MRACLMFRLSDFLASVRTETDLEQQKKPLRLGSAQVDAMESSKQGNVRTTSHTETCYDLTKNAQGGVFPDSLSRRRRAP